MYYNNFVKRRMQNLIENQEDMSDNWYQLDQVQQDLEKDAKCCERGNPDSNIENWTCEFCGFNIPF